MKIIAVYGSMRADSHSSIIMDAVVKGAAKAGHEVIPYHISSMNLKGCMGCGQCQKNKCDCVILDDLADYWKNLHDCDALILSAPNYMGQIAGQMISFMNRHYCMGNQHSRRLEKEIKLVGIFSQGAPATTGIYDSVYEWYLKVFQGIGMNLVKKIVVGGGSDFSENSELLQEAYQTGNELDTLQL